MIRFFRYSGPLQLGVIFLLIWFFRLPIFFGGAPLLHENVELLAVSAKMADGYLMYRDIIYDLGPVAAAFYWFFGICAGSSIHVFYIIAAFVLFFQSQLFKWICHNNDLLSDKTEIPALVYVIVASTCFDFFSLTPAFISVTFILIAINSIYKHIKSENNDSEIFTTGMYLGLAYLTYSPNLVFLLLSILTFIVFTRTTFRYYLLLFIGFIFPVLFCVIVFYLFDALPQFVSYFILKYPVNHSLDHLTDWKTISFLIVPSLLFSIIGLLRALTYRRFIIYQVIGQRIMFIWLFVVGLICFLVLNNHTSAFVIMIPFVAFFITHFFQLIKQNRLGGALLVLYVVYNLRMVYSYFDIPYLGKNLVNFNNQMITPSPLSKEFENKKILMIGKDNAIFMNNKIATCYFDYEISREILGHPEYYENLNHIYVSFFTDLPEVIIDEEKFMPMILSRIPALNQRYFLAKKGIYIKK